MKLHIQYGNLCFALHSNDDDDFLLIILINNVKLLKLKKILKRSYRMLEEVTPHQKMSL